MIRRFATDESGITMPLALITMVLIGVMGAGLLTFVTTDLTAVVETNQGQKALEMAEAGVEAARRELVTGDNSINVYDGGSNDTIWSYCYQGGASPAPPSCTSDSPTSSGASGMTVKMGANLAQVTILEVGESPPTYKVVSEGKVGQARRKVEAMFQGDPLIGIPGAYFSRGDLLLTGSADPKGTSFFTAGNATVSGSASLSEPDKLFGRWAKTSGSGPYPNGFGSYPNQSNKTARDLSTAGIGALKSITGSIGEGTRSYDSTPITPTTPKVVPDYDASALDATQKIAFPFEVSSEAKDKEEIEALRQQALKSETPSSPRYIDQHPGNGINDAGLAPGSRTISSWPSGSTASTTIFYEYASYSGSNDVSYSPPDSEAPCGAADAEPPANAARGVIVVENGDVVWSGNKGFYGGVIARPYDNSGNLITTAPENFRATGNVCLRGYANTGGQMSVSGNIQFGSAPALGTLAPFRGNIDVVSWRELY